MLHFQPVEPRPLIGTNQLRLGAAGQGQEISQVLVADLPGLARLGKLFARILPDGLEQPVARLLALLAPRHYQ